MHIWCTHEKTMYSRVVGMQQQGIRRGRVIAGIWTVAAEWLNNVHNAPDLTPLCQTRVDAQRRPEEWESASRESVKSKNGPRLLIMKIIRNPTNCDHGTIALQ